MTNVSIQPYILDDRAPNGAVADVDATTPVGSYAAAAVDSGETRE
ncbi:hypothetical protein [Halohasta salina]|nr:hypothetical protein [Halohasta salina]